MPGSLPSAGVLLEMLDRATAGLPAGAAALASGYPCLDEGSGGFFPGELVVVAGRASRGKTALLVNLALNLACGQGLPVACFALATPAPVLLRRLLAARAGVDGRRLQRGMLEASDRHRVVRAREELGRAPLFIDAGGGLAVADLALRLAELPAPAPRLVLVEGLQLVQPDAVGTGRRQELGCICTALKTLAEESDAVLLVESQLDRASQPPRRSDLLRAEETALVDRFADHLVFVEREPGSRELELLIAKTPRRVPGSVYLDSDWASGRIFQPGQTGWRNRGSDR